MVNLRALKKRVISAILVTLAFVGAHSDAQIKPQAWVASWSAAQQIPESQNALAADDLRDATVRQIVHLSIGGPALRVHVSNAFGTEALHFTSVHIARPRLPRRRSIRQPTGL
jgi:hypothetical protein